MSSLPATNTSPPGRRAGDSEPRSVSVVLSARQFAGAQESAEADRVLSSRATSLGICGAARLPIARITCHRARGGHPPMG
jgi:hypothetical protein